MPFGMTVNFSGGMPCVRVKLDHPLAVRHDAIGATCRGVDRWPVRARPSSGRRTVRWRRHAARLSATRLVGRSCWRRRARSARGVDGVGESACATASRPPDPASSVCRSRAAGPAHCRSSLLRRSASRQRTDVHVELVARQTRGEQGKLLFRAAAVETRNDLKYSMGHFTNLAGEETSC